MRHSLAVGLLAAAACLGDPSSPATTVAARVNGVWRANLSDGTERALPATLDLWQSGSSVGGVAYVAGVRYPVSGQLGADSTLTITFDDGAGDFEFEGRVDNRIQLSGRLVGFEAGDPIDAVFLKDPDHAAPFNRVAGTWTASWVDDLESWSLEVTLDQISEQIFVTWGTLSRTSEPTTEIRLEGGSTGSVDGTVGTQSGVRFLMQVIESYPPQVMLFRGRFTSPTTIDGELTGFPDETATVEMTLVK